MNLLIDVGNTSLRWTLQDRTDLGPVHSVRHGGGLPIDLLAAWETLEPPSRVLMGNVAGTAVGTAVTRVVRSYWGVQTEQAVTRADAFGVRVAYAQPERLGVDRWLSLVAARGLYGGACLVVDAGSAVTYDALLPDGRHLGGLILPGIEAMRRALLAGTSIPWLQPGSETLEARTEPDLSAGPWAADSWGAVAAGGILALGALTERLFDRLGERPLKSSTEASLAGSVEAESGAVSDAERRARVAPPRLILTGGDAERIAPAVARPLDLVPDLVLRGLARLTQGAESVTRTP